MQPVRKVSRYIVATACFLVVSPGPAIGSGFGVFTQSAAALGQANAVIAHHERPSAVFFNPALLTNLSDTQVEIGTTVIFSDREFESDTTGQTIEAENDANLPSSAYLSYQVNDRLTLGLGVFFPFGLKTEWPENWEGRYLSTTSSLFSTNVRPVIAARLQPWLSVSAGIDYVYLDTKLENKIPLGENPDGHQEFSGDGDGWGFNLGLLIDPAENWAVGAFYRSEVEVDIGGDIDFSLPPIPESSFFRDGSGNTSVTLPQQVMAGIAYSGFQNIILEAGLRWEDWESFEDIVIELDSGLAKVLKRGWKSTFAVNAGVRYQLSRRVAVLAGYLYGEDAVPSEVLDPSLPDSDTHLFSTGTEIIFGRASLALAYGYQMLEDRDKNNEIGAAIGAAANGSYRTDLHLLGASAGYRF